MFLYTHTPFKISEQPWICSSQLSALPYFSGGCGHKREDPKTMWMHKEHQIYLFKNNNNNHYWWSVSIKIWLSFHTESTWPSLQEADFWDSFSKDMRADLSKCCPSCLLFARIAEFINSVKWDWQRIWSQKPNFDLWCIIKLRISEVLLKPRDWLWKFIQHGKCQPWPRQEATLKPQWKQKIYLENK